MDYMCPGCQDNFKKSEQLLDHFLKVHMGRGVVPGKLQCVEAGCKQFFPTPESLQQHCSAQNHGKPKATCTDAIVPNGDELIVTSVHDNEPTDKGETSQGRKPGKEKQPRRESTASQGDEGNSNGDLGDSQVTRKNYCEDCAKQFSSKDSLDRHLQLHKGVKYPCVLCGKVYSQKYAWAQHMKVSHKEWREPTIRTGERTWRAQERCPYCSEYLPTLTEIEKHVTERHCLNPWE